MTTITDTYIAAWNEADPQRRRALVAETWTADGIAEMIGAAQGQFPGHRFELAFGPDAHHDVVRFAWRLVDGDGGAVAAGTDFATVAEDGRFRAVTGFLEGFPGAGPGT